MATFPLPEVPGGAINRWPCGGSALSWSVPGHQDVGTGQKDVRHKNVLLARSFCLASSCLLLERRDGREQKLGLGLKLDAAIEAPKRIKIMSKSKM